MGGLKWMKDMGFIEQHELDNSMKHIMEKKKHKTSGDPHPGSSTGAAAAVDIPAPPPKRKLDKQDEAWIKAHALPNVVGCSITHVNNGKETSGMANILLTVRLRDPAIMELRAQTNHERPSSV